MILTVPFSLEDALNQKPVTFKTLDGRNLTIAIDVQICPQICKLVENEGMPKTSTPEFKSNPKLHLLPFNQIPRGSLYLKFDISFPSHFNQETLTALINALKKNEEECNEEF